MSRPRLYYMGCDEQGQTNPYIEEVIRQIPLLNDKYRPPPVWGINGHAQTAIYSIMTVRPGLDLTPLRNTRRTVVLPDKSSVTYDMFSLEGETLTEEIPGARSAVTLVICPGLANSSECVYIRAFALQAVLAGYKVAALNHLGTVDDPLTTPRLFTFGSTEEYGAMVDDVIKTYPTSKLIAVGFSLGGSLVCKYLGENVENQKHFIACLSLCQGFDFLRMKERMNSWAKLKKFYAMQLTNKVRENVVKNWASIKQKIQQPDSVDSSEARKMSDISSKPHASSSSGDDRIGETESNGAKDSDLRRVMKCKLMPNLDELVTIKLTGHNSVDEYYRAASSRHYLNNIDLPTLFVNSKDDPLYLRELLDHPLQRAKTHRQTLFVLTTHGGHLGFFTKTGKTMVDPTTWLEEICMQYINAVVDISSEEKDDITNSAMLMRQQEDITAVKLRTKISRESEKQTTCSIDVNANTPMLGNGIHRTVPLHHELYNYVPRSWSTTCLEDQLTRHYACSSFTEVTNDCNTDDDSVGLSLKRSETTGHFNTTV